MGSEEFRKGIHNFLVKFSYKNAVTQDLFNELAAVSSEKLDITKVRISSFCYFYYNDDNYFAHWVSRKPYYVFELLNSFFPDYGHLDKTEGIPSINSDQKPRWNCLQSCPGKHFHTKIFWISSTYYHSKSQLKISTSSRRNQHHHAHNEFYFSSNLLFMVLLVGAFLKQRRSIQQDWRSLCVRIQMGGSHHLRFLRWQQEDRAGLDAHGATFCRNVRLSHATLF